MELQNEPGFTTWYSQARAELNNDPLFEVLSKQRNFVVHRGMLVPESRGAIGITEGRGMKLGLTFPVHPLEDSEHAMDRYLRHAKENGDFLGILILDEDSQPCIERKWRLPDFDDDLVDVCANAWIRVGETVREVLVWLGEDVPSLSLDCRHSSQAVKFRRFDRETLISRMTEFPDD